MVKGDNAAALADELLDAKREMDVAKARYEKIRIAVLEVGRKRLEGARGVVTIKRQQRTALDAKAVQRLLTRPQMASCMKTSEFDRVDVLERGKKSKWVDRTAVDSLFA